MRIPGDAVAYFKTTNRYRDIAIHPDRRTFYICTDSAGPKISGKLP